ncbi:hypothetical protein [Clostridium tetanomorphum]|nr:hypothetical protein [Clostridium tetanomorphum]SQC00760.1 Uncharacterised protein [Clostridium tetanomorphum]
MSSQIGVINGSLLEKDILNPYAYRSYRSIIRKVNNITGHITIINEMYKK